MSAWSQRPAQRVGGALDVVQWFERLVEGWTRSPWMPFRRPTLLGWELPAPHAAGVERMEEDGMLVVRAELPAIDPDDELDVTLADGLLRISTAWRDERTSPLVTSVRRGSSTRVLPLPEGTDESAIVASYTDGVLEIRVPVDAPATTPIATC